MVTGTNAHWCHEHNQEFIDPAGEGKYWHPLKGTKPFCFEQPEVEEEQESVLPIQPVEVPPETLIPLPRKPRRKTHFCHVHQTKFVKFSNWDNYQHPITGTKSWCVEQEDGIGIVDPIPPLKNQPDKFLPEEQRESIVELIKRPNTQVLPQPTKVAQTPEPQKVTVTHGQAVEGISITPKTAVQRDINPLVKSASDLIKAAKMLSDDEVKEIIKAVGTSLVMGEKSTVAPVARVEMEISATQTVKDALATQNKANSKGLSMTARTILGIMIGLLIVGAFAVYMLLTSGAPRF